MSNEKYNQTMNFKNCLGVFQGGGCKALAFVGAYKEVKKRGVNFSEVAGTSAGSIFAALIAAGATPEYLENLLFKVDFKSFNAPVNKQISDLYGFNKFKFWRKSAQKLTKPTTLLNKFLRILDNLGMYSSEELEKWLSLQLKDLLKIHDREVYFSDLKIPLHVIATDINKQQQIIWSSDFTPNESVAKAVRCSCTIPLYFQPVEMKYLDGGLVSNLPSFTFNEGERHFEKILCFTLSGKSEPVKCIESYFKSIAGSIIDGAVNIQGKLQNNTYNIVIRNLPVTTTDFELIDEVLINETIDIGSKAASEFFDNEIIELSKQSNSNQVKLSRDYILNSIVMEDVGNYRKIYLCFEDTKIIYSLFPTILGWLTKNVNITFITRYISEIANKPNKFEHEEYRRFLIKRFGIRLIEKQEVPFNGILFKGTNDKTILMYNDEEVDLNVGNGAIYDSKNDLHVNKAFYNMLNIEDDEDQIHMKIKSNMQSFTVESISSEEHIQRLKQVEFYNSDKVSFSESELDLADIKLMTKYVKSYKYNQISRLQEFLCNYSLSVFEPSVIKFKDDVELLITPVIIEKHGSNNVVIKGNSRLSYFHRDLDSSSKFKAIVVSGVSKELPSTGRTYPINDIIITTKNKEGATRYENWVYNNFRNIEESVRNPNSFKEL